MKKDHNGNIELILYVDDEEKNLDSFRIVFRKEYNVKVANSASEGLEFMKENPVSLVITDQRMPNMTGVEFLEKISGLYPDVMRVILTGYSDEEAIISAINKGRVFKYVTKPWIKEELKQTIDYSLEAYRLRVENKELIHKLSKTNQELDEFVYRASHDLRAPIASVLGLINLAKEETDVEKLKEYLVLKELSVKKLDSLIHDIVQFSRNSHIRINLDELDVEKVVENSILKYKDFLWSEQVSKSVEIDADVPFSSDQLRLEIILDNLISNAIRYANLDQEDPQLKVTVKITLKEALVSVKDNGIGIVKEQMDKVFEMFYRATEDNTGSGFGLYIMREAVNKLNGKIELESNQNIGSKFTVTIPNHAS